MASKHMTIRMDPGSFERLERESQRQRVSRSEMARTLLEEGLRMEAYPGVVFKPGPSGRRAAVLGGPDVWEIIGGFPEGDFDDSGIRYVAEMLALPEWLVRQAVRYYLEFREEIDERYNATVRMPSVGIPDGFDNKKLTLLGEAGHR